MSAVNLGMGACPMGSVPLGFGMPGSIDGVTPRPLIQSDGTQGDVARLNTTTGDYIVDEFGNKVGWTALDQEVYFRLRTELGSCADTAVGIDLPIGGTITPDLSERNRNAVELALAPLTGAGLVQIVDVITTRLATSAVKVEVRWRDLSNGDDEKVAEIPQKAF